MTIEEKKAKLYMCFAGDIDHLLSDISRIVFNITDSVYTSDYYKDSFSGEDLGELWDMVHEWAWEFEYMWVIENNYDTDEYPFMEVDMFSDRKIEEKLTRTFTCVYQITNRIQCKAKSFREADEWWENHGINRVPTEDGDELGLVYIIDDSTGEEQRAY